VHGNLFEFHRNDMFDSHNYFDSKAAPVPPRGATQRYHSIEVPLPAVFVHGNPETAAVWDELFAHLLRKDIVALSPPGFGAPVPEGFDATSDAYLQMKMWGQDLPKATSRPGLVIIPTEDPYTGGEMLAWRSAERAGARVAVLQGRGHWWMLEDPALGARVLDEFFVSLVAGV
jgi:pimeloyl-ACP methyl ester carboxylesterase